MTEEQEILEQFLQAIAEEIKGRLPSVSGATKEGIQVEVTQQQNGPFSRVTGRVTAPSYISVFETGRPPTKEGASKGNPTLQEAIQKWIEQKNFRWTKEIKKGGETFIKVLTTKEMSWAIAIKIHREGNKLFRELRGNRTGIITDSINDQRIKQFMDIFAEKRGRLILADVVKSFNLKQAA